MVLFRDKKGARTDNPDKAVIVKELRSLPTPKPVPDNAAYLRELKKALAFSVKRRNNYIKYQQARSTGEPVNYLPVKMDIENVSRCNFRCSMCQVSNWDKGRRARDMTFEEFKNLIDEQYGLVEIKLQGMGEPCLGNSTFYDSIKYARSQHIWVRSVTNASLLHKNDNYRKIIDSGTNELQISIDGADKDTFEKIRYGSTFEKIVDNCKLINSYCEEIGVVRTKMWTVVQKSNCHQLRELVQLAHEMKFHNMVFSMSLTDWGLDNWSVTNNAVTADGVFSFDFAQELIELGKSYGIDVGFWDMYSTYDSSSNKTLCKWPFERAFVSSDMRVVPCCMIANPDTVELGDAVNFTKTWFGTEYQNFRQRHLDGNIPEICQRCYR